MASYQNELFPDEYEMYDVYLNPKSPAVRELRTQLRRAEALDELCRRHLELSEGDLEYARKTKPNSWGSISKTKGGPANPRTLLDAAFPAQHRYLVSNRYWEYTFMTWYTGGLARQVRAIKEIINAVD